MANSLTNLGQTDALYGTATPNGGLANLAATVRLFTSATSPAKDGTGFTEPASVNGYAPIAISRASWSISLDSGDEKLVLANQVWTAIGPISNIEGAWIADGSGAALAWWDRGSAASLTSGDTVTLNGLYIKLT